MTNTTNQDLTQRINSYYPHWAQTEDQKQWDADNAAEIRLKADLNKLNTAQLKEVYAGLTEDGKSNYFGKAIKAHLDKQQPNKTSKLSTIFKNAWFYFRKGIYTSFSDCLKAAWKAFKMVRALKAGVVEFTFRKATGAIRKAKGTLNGSLFTFTAKGVRGESKPDAVKYYDLEKDAWRMFRIERLLEVAL